LAENIRFDAKPALFFDGRNLLNGPALQEIGFVYQAIGS
jgi:UDPglucose 6-dehydrogenase